MYTDPTLQITGLIASTITALISLAYIWLISRK